MDDKSNKLGNALSQEHHDLIQQFEADYNAVDHFLRKSLHTDHRESFSRLVTRYHQRNRHWRDADLLNTVADIRNTIVHGKTKAYEYPAIPSPSMTAALTSCRERLINPVCVLPTFGKKVEHVDIEDDLAKVLTLINKRDYSQFPVYSGDTFKGLLTENGITRWLARHVSEILSLVELEEILVSDMLQDEEDRENCYFVKRNTPVDEAAALFADKPLLEALFVTESGTKGGALLGIATRWDMLRDPSTLS